MATNFPASQDNFTNPTSGSSLSSPSHSQQHSDVNDAVEAIEGALLDGAPLHIDDANERVGIGTTSPRNLLEVQGSSSGSVDEVMLLAANGTQILGSGARLHLSGGNGTGRSVYIEGVNTGGATNAHAMTFGTSSNSANPVERMRIDSNGKVGIGTTSPSQKLHVNSGAGNVAGLFESTDSVALVQIKDNATTTPPAVAAVGDAMRLQTSGSSRLTVDSSGYVGINDTTPSYQLDVNGSEDTASRININSANTANRYLMRFSRNNVLLANGVYADTGTAYFGTPSDVNLKTGIESISTSDALTALNALRAVDYRYLLDTDDVVRKGFIAQEVEEVIPEAVKRVGGGHPTTQLVFDENGDLQAESVDENGDPLVQEKPDIILNWEPITTTLVAAVQELSSLATTLVARIEALEAG